ncbi:MAG: hypothetical protein OXU33_01690 [Gemmatimonadota bacterium]|nr:hypothetical protein [Gemmatimonadota bacterium]MDE3007155.1 hypothetical protein [Gemmatimonadota bacterium]MDE3012773.1 hypothetical protein [Gemmatimonadota bacterium]
MTNIRNTAQYRRALTAGLSFSVAAHITALLVVSVPGVGPGDIDAPRTERPTEHFDAVEVVQIVEQAPPMVPTEAPRPTASTAGARAETPTAGGDAAALEALFAGIEPATVALSRPSEGRPVVTLKDLDLISADEDLMTALYGDLLAGATQVESSGGGLGGLLSSIGSALSGGGHCPTPITGAQSR